MRFEGVVVGLACAVCADEIGGSNGDHGGSKYREGMFGDRRDGGVYEYIIIVASCPPMIWRTLGVLG